MAVIKKIDTVLTDSGWLYRYDTKKNLMAKFDNSIVVKRTFGSYEPHYICFFPNNKEGVTISKNPKEVHNRNATHFYFWNHDYVNENEASSIFIKAIDIYYDKVINDYKNKIKRFEQNKNKAIKNLKEM